MPGTPVVITLPTQLTPPPPGSPQMNISGGSEFVAGPMPKHNEAPEGAPYSGLLECKWWLMVVVGGGG